jgi:C4-dicarboxylate-specific signal transduction histidine kinase
VGVRRLVEDVAWVIRAKAETAEVVLETGEIPEDLWLKGDGAGLRQALLGLVANAVEAAARSSRRPRTVRVEARRGKAGVELEVLDSGPGVPADLKEKVFHPFFTTKPAGEGLGLGLTTARRFVQGHGGQLSVQSVPGRTSFLMVFPDVKG